MFSRKATNLAIIKKYFLGVAYAILVFSVVGCATKSTLVKVMEPSQVHLSKSIKKIGIINSSVPSEVIEVTDRLHEVVDAENRWLAKKGTEAAIAGLFDELVKDDRFGTIKLLDSVPEALQDFGADPENISWPAVEALCRLHDVDVIFSLAFYETETKVSIKKSSLMQPNMVRVKVKVPAKEITLETLIENGWRIYDPRNSQVLDEMVFNDQFTAKGKGTDAILALQAVDRKDTVLLHSRTAGSQYGLRLQPSEKSIARYYYVRGSDNLTKARNLVAEGDWQGAIDLWELEATNPDHKINGRGCHNMAVACERKGDLKMAIEWATKANLENQSKNSRSYLHALEQRISQNDGTGLQLVGVHGEFEAP